VDATPGRSLTAWFSKAKFPCKSKSKKRLPCLGLFEHRARTRLSRYSIAGSADQRSVASTV
jgi:hypothetical protein